MHTELWCRSHRERDNLENLGIDMRPVTNGLVGYGLDSSVSRWCPVVGGL